MDSEKEPQSQVSMNETPKIQDNKKNADAKSHTSTSARRSTRSQLSMVNVAAATARAEAEAAKARASFIRKEMNIKIEKARLEAELDALKQEAEAEAAIAKAIVMENAAVELSSHGSQRDIESLPSQSPQDKVSEYVERHSRRDDSHPDEQFDISQQRPSALLTLDEERGSICKAFESLSLKPHHSYGDCEMPKHSSPHQAHLHYSELCQPDSYQHTPKLDSQQRSSQQFQSIHQKIKVEERQQVDTSDHKKQQVCSHYNPDPSPSHDLNSNTSDLAKFLIRSQLVSGGLTKFDDRPENFLGWKSTFISVVKGLDISAHEQIDLLIKWLGPESSYQARRMKAANVRQPLVGLNLIWERLDELYGAPEAIEKALFAKLDNFPRIGNRDNHRLRELGDLLCELEAAKEDGYLQGLAYLDTARGVSPIVEKLPFHLQDKWMTVGSKYKEDHRVHFPPFSVFSEFIRRQARARNDPSFYVTNTVAPALRKERMGNLNYKNPVSVHKTSVSNKETTTDREGNQTEDVNMLCPIHKKPHALKKCKSFRAMLLDDRKKFLRDKGVCFRCCASVSHQAKDCGAFIKCAECGSERHVAAMHFGPAPRESKDLISYKEQKDSKEKSSSKVHGGEPVTTPNDEQNLAAKPLCTQVCGKYFRGKSCSKICLVNVYPEGHPEKSKRMYVILDDQSNVSLAKTEFFDAFRIQGPRIPYILTTCAGVVKVTGRRAHGFMVEPLTGELSIALPTLIECNNVPNSRAEIPTPEAAYRHSHMRAMVDQIPALDDAADILLLLGRDILQVHKVRRQFNGPDNAPFAQKHDLGWVIVGDVCLGGAHTPTEVNTFKTCIMDNGRPSYMLPCENLVKVKEDLSQPLHQNISLPWSHSLEQQENLLGATVFQRTEKDNQLAPSIDDLTFLQLMDKGFVKDESGSWVAPLPFRNPRRPLPNNRQQAHQRLMSLQRAFQKRPSMKEDFLEFMQGILDNNHAELAPPSEGREVWYLPIFGVYHPHKPGKIRVVFDSSARFEGVSLNEVLLQGPNLNNSLLGVLLRFRKEPVAITADVRQMFYCFLVQEEHRDVLRFLWFKDNNPESEVVDYRMRVHVFGNSPSPAVATYGLRRAAQEGEKDFGRDVCEFIKKDFYVDDALRSFATEAEAVDVLKRAQNLLAGYNIKLHKITSNKVDVINAFPKEDRARGLETLDLAVDDLPIQRSLGVAWDRTRDTFTFNIPEPQKPFTRRGVLSTINSVFDPLGFLAPVTVEGRLLLRELVSQGTDWDSPLPPEKFDKWQRWQDSLQGLNHLNISRTYSTCSLTRAKATELCVFSDASVKAIAAVAYLKVETDEGHTEVSFVLGKAKLAPLAELTIPRLELCAAVLATEIADQIREEIGLMLDRITFFTDSKVVLGYITNESRRFYVYVNNRVQRIRQSSHPGQWRYVATENNPADLGSRSVAASQLQGSSWLTGPRFLLEPEESSMDIMAFELVNPDSDVELRPKVTALSTKVSGERLDTKRFERFSSWSRLTRAVARLLHVARSLHKPAHDAECVGWHYCKKGITSAELTEAEHVIIKSVQCEVYAEEMTCFESKQDLPGSSPLKKLHPVRDKEGLLRVGGRITHSNLPADETHPILIPGKHHLAVLLIRHHHEQVKHQGRHFTEGAVRGSGLWIVGAKRAINSLIYKCVTCRKLRGRLEQQQMADLPPERLQQEPPFTYVGLDVFGPWEVVARRTRGGIANSKRWAILFTCMSTRAVHLEVIESMTASSCINALRRFFSIRGPAKQIRSDRGTNFVGATNELKLAPDAQEDSVNVYLLSQKCTWVFNPPHASNMGGSWERMIGTARRILDSMLLQEGRSKITHEVLCTLMAEVMAIINSRPLIPVSSDPEAPLILTPAMLLTQKIGTPPVPSGNFSDANLLKHAWKKVQALADTFWARWRLEYLNTLQIRQKWHTKKPNLKDGDIVLLKDKQARRHEWSMGVIAKAFQSDDGLVRKVEVKVASHQPPRTYLRPVSEVVLLLESEVV